MRAAASPSSPRLASPLARARGSARPRPWRAQAQQPAKPDAKADPKAASLADLSAGLVNLGDITKSHDKGGETAKKPAGPSMASMNKQGGVKPSGSMGGGMGGGGMGGMAAQMGGMNLGGGTRAHARTRVLDTPVGTAP